MVRLDHNDEWEFLPEGYNLVHIGFGVFHPCGHYSLYLRKVICEERFLNFQNKLQTVVEEELKKKKKEEVKCRVGDYCLAKYYKDSCFYRARVEKVEGTNISVFYVDFGNLAVVKTSDVVHPPQTVFSELPFQAIEFTLFGINLKEGEQWSQEMEEIFSFLTAGDFYFYAKTIIEHDSAERTGERRYDIALTVVEDEARKVLNKVLLEEGIVVNSENYTILEQVESEVKFEMWQPNPHCHLLETDFGGYCPFALQCHDADDEEDDSVLDILTPKKVSFDGPYHQEKDR